MTVEQLPAQVREFVSCLDALLGRLDQGGGWCAVFWQRDPDGMRACLDGTEMPPWDVVEALLQDLASAYGPAVAEREARQVRALHAAALRAHDSRPGARDALGDRLDVMLREQRYAVERQAELGRQLSAAVTREQADGIRLDLAWAHDDHERATARCAELRARMAELDRLGGGFPEAGARRAGTLGRDVKGRLRGFGGSEGESEGAEAESGGRAGGPVGGGWASGDGGGGARGGGWAVGGAGGGAGRSEWAAGGVEGGARGVGRGSGEAEGASPGDGRGSGGGEGAVGGAVGSVPGEGGSGDAGVRGGRGGAGEVPGVTPAAVPKQRKRRRGSARFAGVVEEEGAAVVVPEEAVGVVPEGDGGRGPRGARFAGAGGRKTVAPVRTEPVVAPDAAARQETAEVVRRLVALRGEGRSGEAHALLVELASWPAVRIPLVAGELQRAGLGADWSTLLWEAASLPAERLVEAADALTGAGRAGDGEQILRQGVARPAEEIGEAVLGLAGDGRRREVRALLDAYVRVRAPEEAARSVAPDPRTLVPLLVEAARGVSEERYWDVVHALRVAGFTA
ncbi:hypothetical protein PV682_04955 [Streptomyces niveiscabiei]|uniref:hypothetical protein n=1 Tax=Streptomyces niveiscabiei TaxID=164115 RepID=UPI0029B99647|nr:hypothetical protein [Streptomyces niveiscabiei]MDX3380797.1 hypothetical protein [Streptomyces niveiscabiei]